METVEYYNHLMADPAYTVQCAWGGTERGRYLVATKPIAAEEEVLCEMPVLAWPHPAAAKSDAVDVDPEAAPWVQYLPKDGVVRARAWQQRKDKAATVTLEAIARAVAHVAFSYERCLEAGVPEAAAVDHAVAPFSRLAQPDGVMGEWTEEYHAALPTILDVPAVPAGLKTEAFDLFSLPAVNMIIGAIALNAVTITLPTGGSGSGLYTLTANINHSCAPTARVETEPGSFDVSVKALRPLEPGEELTISYVPVKLSLKDRRQRLKKYDFKCECTRCGEESGGAPTAPAAAPASSS